MLGVIHRSVLGLGPDHFAEFFRPEEQGKMAEARHNRQLADPRAKFKGPLLRRSALRLVAVYNLLPAYVVEMRCVKAFPSQLQLLVASRCKGRVDGWQKTLSPREPLLKHALVS